MNLLCLGDERVLSQFSIHVGETRRPRLRRASSQGFLSLFAGGGGGCEGTLKLPSLFLRDHLPLNKDFQKLKSEPLKNWKIGMRPFFGKKAGMIPIKSESTAAL